MDYYNAKMVTILKTAQEMQELWPFEQSYFTFLDIIKKLTVKILPKIIVNITIIIKSLDEHIKIIK